MGRIGIIALTGSVLAGLFATASPLIANEGSAGNATASEASHSRAFASDRGYRSGQSMAKRILHLHNAERDRLSLPRLKWNQHLEREAAEWAHELGRRGRLEHASSQVRNGTGENLWMGTAGAWDIDTMVGMFLEERKHYRHAAFPNISRTGNWADVGHYTQIVWRDTREVGCAVVTQRGNDVLVCRYWPAGNVWGSRAY